MPTLRLGMHDLALQVGEIDRVVIDQRDLCRCLPKPGKAPPANRGRPAPMTRACADRQARLALDAQSVEQDVAAIAE
jgi:hypothetical protein